MPDDAQFRSSLAWYYHQPWVIGDDDVGDLVRESIEPLLAVHADLEAPVTLAITGALLERLARIAPQTVARLAGLVERRVVEIAATFHHEIYPHFFDPQRLQAHVDLDRAAKQKILGVSPTTFLPANFAWSPLMAPLLAAMGIRRVLLDGRHLSLAGAMQRWKWRALGPEAPILSSALPPSAVHRSWLLSGETGTQFDLLFRDVSRVEAFSFGDAGGIHRPLDSAAQAGALAALTEGRRFALLADDGDRVNALSVGAYRCLIEQARDVLARAGDLVDEQPRRLDFLCGFSLGDYDDFWLAGPESRHWLRLLDALHAQFPPADPGVLALHDVYPLFWRTHWRSRQFWERAYALLSSAQPPPHRG